jgi:hypothetical protein
MTKEQLHKANEIDRLREYNFRYKQFANNFKELDKTSSIAVLIQIGGTDYKIRIEDVELLAVCFKSMYDYCNAKEEELKTKFENM